MSWDASSCVGASRVDGVFLDIQVLAGKQKKKTQPFVLVTIVYL